MCVCIYFYIINNKIKYEILPPSQRKERKKVYAYDQ